MISLLDQKKGFQVEMSFVERSFDRLLDNEREIIVSGWIRANIGYCQVDVVLLICQHCNYELKILSSWKRCDYDGISWYIDKECNNIHRIIENDNDNVSIRSFTKIMDYMRDTKLMVIALEMVGGNESKLIKHVKLYTLIAHRMLIQKNIKAKK